jgi:regulator of replication initiation timing
VDLESIDRLEEKVKQLVGLIDRLRGEHAKAVEENTRLSRELDQARSQLTDAETASTEMLALREERDLIRSRVDDMLQQIESLNL